MQLKKIVIGNQTVSNNVFLAPIAGYTDGAFRKEIISLGIGLTFTELVSAKGLIYGANGNKVLLSSSDYSKTAVQIFGGDEYFMRKACESPDLAPFNIVDINMGCPVPKVFNNGEGSALLLDVKRAQSIIKECSKSGKEITVKIRTGLKKGDDIASDFAMACEDAGAKLITVHGRVREDYYSGEPDYKAIEKVKHSVKIPVIANGGIFTESDANDMMDRTGADGVMLARGALKNPFLVATLTNTSTDKDMKKFIINHVKGMLSVYPERQANVEFRKFVPYYFHGVKNSKELRLKLMATKSVEEIIDIIKREV